MKLFKAFANERSETVTVKGADGEPLIINKSDYSDKHFTLYEADTDQPDGDDTKGDGEPDKPEGATNTGTMMVDKRGQGRGKPALYFVTDADGKDIENVEGINSEGYESEADAWGAITTALTSQ